jgi:UDP-N-acetylglucosamine diphosphorylase/glucosamine-1-phosphate N-acetyltransferase
MSHVIILAGGKGTRMKSDLPKVLHEVKGISIIKRLLKNIEPVCAKPTLIVGHKAEDVISATDNSYYYALQKEQLGTGHAIMCAEIGLKDRHDDTIIVIPGDSPLVSAETIQDIEKLHAEKKATITLGTFVAPHFEGIYSTFLHFGRIIRDENGNVKKIVEFKDATDTEKACLEVNVSYYCFDATWLWTNIHLLSDKNAAKEYYLTDMIKIAKDQNKIITAYPVKNIVECLGINTPEQLKMVEDAIDQQLTHQ